MKRCFTGLVLLLLVVAVPVWARVVSYAPYTNRVAVPSFQERTTRHFVLIESTPEELSNLDSNEVVLYDSTGQEEPRVVAPKDGVHYDQVALYQKPGGAPVILATGMLRTGARRLAVRNGEVWTEITGTGGFYPLQTWDTDTGGPFTHGLFAPVAIGNDTWPFVVSLGSNGVWAINANGASKAVYKAPDARVIGRNRSGDRFLIYSSSGIWITGVDGPATKIATVDPSAAFAGWITASGTAYVEMLRPEGRFLFTTANGLQFVAGPYNTNPPQLGAPPQWGTTMNFFAVPTRDYEGAWIIQRGAGKPTKLLRHTVGGALETMWSEVSGPQVEALIPSASTDAVLVQVHREREGVELNRPFVDPALAVWRAGQPAPRSYDELYLNESWNKGFIHVDVDAIEGGTPFVFNSGFQQQDTPSRVSPPIAGGGDVIQEWGVVRGSLKQRLVLPGVARLNGAFGSFWMTDLTVYNPLDTQQEVEVRFVPLGTQGSGPATATTTLTMEPFEIRAVPDALKTLFAVESGGGTLHFLPAVGINATARTYSRKGNGTFGFGMQAIDHFNAAGPRFNLSFAGAFPGENFRTNLLITDTSGRGTEARLQASGISGFLASTDASVASPAEGTIQVNGIGPSVGLLASAGGGLVVQPTRGTAIVTVVAIDNRTNDPTYFPPDLPAAVVRAIPVVGHLDGANGAKFRSDAYIYNPSGIARTVSLAAKMWDTHERRVVNFTLLPNESRVIPDVLKTLFGMEGLARLSYSTNDWQPGEAVRLTSRTYTVEANGATYGCLVPPLNSFQIATFGDRLEILGISGGTGFRTNIGVVDLTDNNQRAPTVRITIVDDKRRVVDSFQVQIPASGGAQFNDIFGSRGLTPPPAAMVVVEVVDGQQIGAYATLTDNVTNDSTYLGAQLGAQPQ